MTQGKDMPSDTETEIHTLSLEVGTMKGQFQGLMGRMDSLEEGINQLINLQSKPKDDKMGLWFGMSIAIISMVGAVAVSYSTIMYADAKEGISQLADVTNDQIERLYERDDTIYTNIDAEMVEIKANYRAGNSKQWDQINRLREVVSRLDERSKKLDSQDTLAAQRVLDLNARLGAMERRP